MKTNIIEGNKLIAEFMGHEVYKDDGYIIPSNKYGISESDMMQHCFTFSVKNDGNIDKFREEHISCGGYYFVVSDFKLKYNSSWNWLMPVVDKVSEISATQQKENNLQLWMFLTADIENVWAKVVEFIKRQDNK